MLPTLEATNLEPAADGGYAISTWVAVPKPQRSSSSSGSFPTVPNQEKTEFRNPVETHSGCPFLTKNLGTSSGFFCFSQWVPWLVVAIGGSSHQAYRTSRSQPWEVVEKHLEKEKGLIKHDWFFSGASSDYIISYIYICCIYIYCIYVYVLDAW